MTSPAFVGVDVARGAGIVSSVFLKGRLLLHGRTLPASVAVSRTQGARHILRRRILNGKAD